MANVTVISTEKQPERQILITDNVNHLHLHTHTHTLLAGEVID